MQLGDVYSYNNYQPVRQPVIEAQPILPAPQPAGFNHGCFKMFGAILALLAAATLSLGIADVVLTMQAYCSPWTTTSPVWCSMTAEPYIWTWVASGIWASIPIFFAGLCSMCLSSNPASWTRLFALLIFLSAIVFAPAMLVLTSVELWRGGSSIYTFYSTNTSSITAGSIMPTGANPYQAKFAIPLVIAILAGIMLLMTAAVTINFCCCMESMGLSMDTAPVVVEQAPVREYYPPRPHMRPQVMDYGDSGIPFGGFSAPNMPTRYNSVPNPYGSGVMYGNFPGNFAPNNMASDFFAPVSSNFWK